MEYKLAPTSRFSAIEVTAALSVLVLVLVGAWEIAGKLGATGATMSASALPPSRGADSSGASPAGRAAAGFGEASSTAGSDAPSDAAYDPDGLSRIGSDAMGQLVGSYMALRQTGAYTPAQGMELANNVAASMQARVSYKTYAESDIKTTSDISYERMLAYRNELRAALTPLLKSPGPEFELFGRYIETQDEQYLAQLQGGAKNYRAAADSAARIVVPEDASSYHIGILNALQQFAAVLDDMARVGDDPLATLALLRTYNAAEKDVFRSFNAIASYQTRKIP